MPEGQSKRMRAAVAVRESKIRGRGVVASREFLAGEVVLEIDDSDPVLERSQLSSEQEIFIDVFVAVDGTQKTTWMKSPERFINHSCDPDTCVQPDMRTGIRQTLALRNLEAGDEITWDYALNIWEEWVGPVTCKCRAMTCRHVIRGSFFTLPRETQRRYVPLLDGPFKKRFAREIQSLDPAAGHGPA